jgi:hypothetical protein
LFIGHPRAKRLVGSSHRIRGGRCRCRCRCHGEYGSCGGRCVCPLPRPRRNVLIMSIQCS